MKIDWSKEVVGYTTTKKIGSGLLSEADVIVHDIYRNAWCEGALRQFRWYIRTKSNNRICIAVYQVYRTYAGRGGWLYYNNTGVVK